MKKEIPNSTLFQATTTTGGICQALVPFGADPKPYFEAESEGDILNGDWQEIATVYACTIRTLVEEVDAINH